MTAEHIITEDELHAYVDGHLSSERHALLAAYLTAHPAVAAQVQGYAEQRRLLREALGPIAEEPVPNRLSLTTLTARQSLRTAPPWRAAAAVVAALALGLGSGWLLRGAAQPPTRGVGALAREAAASYRVFAADADRPVEIPASDGVELARWVARRLSSPVAAPDLRAAGYRFLGGRLVATPHGPAAFYLYQDAGGRRLAVLARPMETEKSHRMAEHADADLGGVSWADQGIGYSLVGRAAPAALHPLADWIRDQMRRRA